MEEESKVEGVVVPDSYQSEEECEKLKSVFESLMQRNVDYNMINENENNDEVDVDEGGEEAKEVDYNMIDDDENNYKVDVDEGDEEAKEVDLEEKNINEEFYMVWFDAFLAKHEFDKDYLDQSSLQKILKTWLQKQLTSAEFRFNEAQIDLSFINFRYAICKQWLSSL